MQLYTPRPPASLTHLRHVLPPVRAARAVAEPARRRAHDDQTAAVARVLRRDGAPRRHVADDGEHERAEVLDQVAVPDVHAVSLARLELGQHPAGERRTIAITYGDFGDQ